ncbi:alpha/beta hydrolase fold domain-containing protein [Paraburkholderia sediminicola]|nr:alpha/beta hydrolase [Paraburkholderia sediminicola]
MDEKMIRKPEEYKGYKTVTDPEKFSIPWQPFYASGVSKTAALQSRFTHHLGLKYGDHPSQILDLYLPSEVSSSTTTIIFLHGGAFREGHPGQYGYIGEPYLAAGAAYISASYRMAPDAFYPDQVEDVAVLVRWLYTQLAAHGLNRHRLIFMGHSSGALMLALAAVRADWQERTGVPVDIIDTIVIAGANFDHLEDSPTNLVRDASRREEGTVVCNIQRVPRRVVIVFATDERNTGDGRRFARSGKQLGARLADKGAEVSIVELDTDHQGTCKSLCDPYGPVVRALLATI